MIWHSTVKYQSEIHPTNLVHIPSFKNPHHVVVGGVQPKYEMSTSMTAI